MREDRYDVYSCPMRYLMVAVAITILWLFSNTAPQARAQSSASSSAAANAGDVASIDSIINAAYDVISGPADKPRDWQRFRSLFISEARFIIAAPSPEGSVGAQVFDTESFIKGFTEY